MGKRAELSESLELLRSNDSAVGSRRTQETRAAWRGDSVPVQPGRVVPGWEKPRKYSSGFILHEITLATIILWRICNRLAVERKNQRNPANPAWLFLAKLPAVAAAGALA
jgi:hypothetical protein